MSSLIVAHHHYFDPPSWPLQYPTKEVLLLMAIDLQLVVIVIFTSAIIPAICNHDCWHHHYHDITQNLAGKLFLCDNGLTIVVAVAIIAVVTIMMAAAAMT